MKIFEDTKIYIFCPHNNISGGPDALHQLYYYMNSVGLDANLVYNFTKITRCQTRFEKYDPKIIRYDEIIDNDSNIIIVPEITTSILRRYKNMQKCIWWLGYEHYDGFCSRSVRAKKYLKNFIKRLLNLFRTKKKYHIIPVSPIKITDNIYNFCGSRYVYENLKKSEYRNVEMFVEPLSLDFIREGRAENLSSENRSDVVLYNPAKPSKIMEKLLKRNDIQFQPIQGMSLQEIIALFRQTKLYIDFGNFGGPERLPKESVYNGTCLLVGKRNAAVNDFDVAIPNEYKIEDYNNEELVVAKIKEILLHYDDHISSFAAFREKIDLLENNFIKSISENFVK